MFAELGVGYGWEELRLFATLLMALAEKNGNVIQAFHTNTVGLMFDEQKSRSHSEQV